MRIFVTGTDTDVGKTLVSAWLCKHFSLAYHKPIQTGGSECSDSRYVSEFSPDIEIIREQYIFAEPISPDIAAQAHGVEIRTLRIPAHERLLIEGAGGIMTPYSRDASFLSFASEYALSTLIVAPSRVGNINHVSLVAHALRSKNVPILGVIICGEFNQERASSITTHSKVRILQHVQHSDLSSDSISPSAELREAIARVDCG